MMNRSKFKYFKVFFLYAILLYSIPGYARFGKESYKYKEVAEYGLAEIQFVGAGDLQLSVDEGKDVPATTGLGALFWRIWPTKNVFSTNSKEAKEGVELQISVQINVSSTMDTLKADFGNFVLAPVGSGLSTSIILYGI